MKPPLSWEHILVLTYKLPRHQGAGSLALADLRKDTWRIAAHAVA